MFGVFCGLWCKGGEDEEEYVDWCCDEEKIAEREEKKRKKEEEAIKKKNEGRGVKQLKKVDTSGMKKMSSFFTVKPKGS